MTRKVYVLMSSQNNSSFILEGQAGLRVRYDFTNGSVIQSVLPSFTTDNPYYQYLLESSELFKSGRVRISQVFETGSTSKGHAVLKGVPSVKDAKSAIEWLANKFGVKTTSGRLAIEEARKRGYSFPNFKKSAENADK